MDNMDILDKPLIFELENTTIGAGAVKSVNGKTGVVILTANDVGAEPDNAVTNHNNSLTAHFDIRENLAQIQNDIEEISSLIPSQSSVSNPLTDREFVNSTVATETAHPLGSLDLVTDLGLTRDATKQQIISALNVYSFSADKTNNDYTYVGLPNSVESSNYDKWTQYKWNAEAETFTWQFDLNNSSFTSNQWTAINSGITATLVTKINNSAQLENGKVPKSNLPSPLTETGQDNTLPMSQKAVTDALDGIKQYIDNLIPQIVRLKQ